MVIYGLIGLRVKKLGYRSRPCTGAGPWVIAPKKTSAREIKGSQGDLVVFFSNGLVGGLTGVRAVLLFWP